MCTELTCTLRLCVRAKLHDSSLQMYHGQIQGSLENMPELPETYQDDCRQSQGDTDQERSYQASAISPAFVYGTSHQTDQAQARLSEDIPLVPSRIVAAVETHLQPNSLHSSVSSTCSAVCSRAIPPHPSVVVP